MRGFGCWSIFLIVEYFNFNLNYFVALFCFVWAWHWDGCDGDDLRAVMKEGEGGGGRAGRIGRRIWSGRLTGRR